MSKGIYFFLGLLNLWVTMYLTLKTIDELTALYAVPTVFTLAAWFVGSFAFLMMKLSRD